MGVGSTIDASYTDTVDEFRRWCERRQVKFTDGVADALRRRMDESPTPALEPRELQPEPAGRNAAAGWTPRRMRAPAGSPLAAAKIEQARRLLAETELAIGEVARRVDIHKGNFHVVFRRHTGLNPGEYRAQAKARAFQAAAAAQTGTRSGPQTAGDPSAPVPGL